MSTENTNLPAGPSIQPATIFRLAKNLGEFPETVKLRNVEWGILFAVTGQHTVAQIGEHFQLTAEERDAAFTRLAVDGFIVEREVSYSEYLRATATLRDEEPKTLARFLRSGVALGGSAPRPALPQAAAPPPVALEARPPKPASASPREMAPVQVPPPRTPAKPAAPVIAASAFDQAPDDTTRAIPTASLAAMFQPLQSPPGTDLKDAPPAEVAPKEEPPMQQKLSLKALMQFILDRAVDLTAGQLDIYRVFIRVNTRLLKKNGITTLRFQDDRLISDPELQSAIVSSVEKTLGLRCPKEVYV